MAKDKDDDRPRLQAAVIGMNGDVQVRLLKSGDVELQVRNVTETETVSSVRLSADQASVVSELLGRAGDIDVSDDDDDDDD